MVIGQEICVPGMGCRGHTEAALVMGQQVFVLRVGRGHGMAGLCAESGEGS